MKRKEAVQLILSTYNQNVYQDYEMHEYEADEILFELEKAGMKPPNIGLYPGQEDSYTWEHEDE